MLRFSWILLPLVLLTVAFQPTLPAKAETQDGIPIFFAETGHTLGYSFRQFYEYQGGLPIFGLPLTEVFIQDGLPVQYFERARLEWHGTIAQVQAGHLGRWVALGHTDTPAFRARAQAPDGASFFPETGHSLGGAFRNFWQQNGGLATFGYPLSEEFMEQNAQDGRMYMVQYFERARFEFHPELPVEFQVQLGHLGRQYLASYPAPDYALQPVSDASQAWNGIRPTHIRIPRIGVGVDIQMIAFSYGEWEVPRYTAAQYWPVSAFPSTNGNIVVAGHVGYRGIIFSQLPETQEGDEVFLTVGGAEKRYIVDSVLMLLPTDTWVMNPTPAETLTLITCFPVGIYSHRLVVRATPAS